MDADITLGPEPVPAGLLWTIMPPAQILAGFDQPRPGEQIVQQGGRVLLVSNENGRRRITRLLSTDPRDYLDDSLAPDSELP